MHEGEKLEAVRAFFDGRVSNQGDHRVKYNVGSGCVFQTSERIEADVERMCWKQLSKCFLTMPRQHWLKPLELLRLQEPSVGLVQSGCIRCDVDGNLKEDRDENGKRNRNRMEDHTEDRHKKKT